jgi:hypothetical protein
MMMMILQYSHYSIKLPLNGLRAQSRVKSSGRIANFSLWTGIKYMRRTAAYTWTDYKTNTQIAKDLKITPVFDRLLEYKRNWIQHVNRMPRNRLPRVMKHYSTTGRRNHDRPLKRLLGA